LTFQSEPKKRGSSQKHLCLRGYPSNDVTSDLVTVNAIDGLPNNDRSDVGIACFAGFEVFLLLN
jgi:hypothetical protein